MKTFKYILALPAIFFLMASCDKKMQEMNTDPLALSELPDEYLFTTAVRHTFGDGGYISSVHLRFACQYAHIYVTNNENRAADSYQDFHTQDIYKEMFSRAYVNPLRYINEVLLITSGDKHKNPVRNAIANIVAVVNYAQITDCWGDIPYFQGAQGSSGILYPAYDKQKDIYPDMMNRLKDAIAVLRGADAANAYPGADPVYDNDLSKWIRFANSLRLRLAMKIRFADPATSAPVIAECLSEPLIETNDQNFELKHQDSDNGELYSPWFDLRKVSYFKMSEKFTDYMVANQDPRLEIFVEPNRAGARIGAPNGLTDQAFGLVNWTNFSNPMPVLYSKSLSQYLMCASEVWFLRAEAALFGLATGDANALYREGIRTSLLQWGVNAETAQNFLDSQSEATLNGNEENRFRQICSQMWVAFVPNFTEAWTHIRRTGYPVIGQRTNPDVYSLGVTDGYLPKRFKYASSEYLNNLDNVTKANENQGPDKIDTPVWWDVRGK